MQPVTWSPAPPPSFDPLFDTAVSAARGCDDAVRALFGATKARLHRTALRIVRDEDAAEDVVVTAYTRAVIALRDGKFRFDAPITAWLDRIVRLGALDAIRARRRDLVGQPLDGTEDTLFDGGPSPEDVAAARAEIRRTATAVADLPARQREALLLTEIEGLSAADAAKRMSCSIGALELLLVRARRTLRARLAA